MTPQPIRIFIADDHAVLRAGLRLLLASQPEFVVIGEAGTHHEVLDGLSRHRDEIHVLLMDLSMPGGSPSALIEDARRLHPGIKVVVLTMHDDPGHARLAMAAGASGYVVKSAADTDLIAAIRTAVRGGVYSTIPLGASGPFPTKASMHAAGRAGPAALSEREREVLLMLARGHTNQQIADSLFLSVKTIESYRARMMTKLGLKDRAELTRYAIDTGLLTRDTPPKP